MTRKTAPAIIALLFLLGSAAAGAVHFSGRAREVAALADRLAHVPRVPAALFRELAAPEPSPQPIAGQPATGEPTAASRGAALLMSLIEESGASVDLLRQLAPDAFEAGVRLPARDALELLRRLEGSGWRIEHLQLSPGAGSLELVLGVRR